MKCVRSAASLVLRSQRSSRRMFSSASQTAEQPRVDLPKEYFGSDKESRTKSVSNDDDDDENDDQTSETRVRKVDSLGRAYGTGRRKTAVAQVWIKEGSGRFEVNKLPFTQYFWLTYRLDILTPFMITHTSGLFDVSCSVHGGGISGQAGAVRLGIARALQNFDPNFRPILRKGKAKI